MALIQLKTAKGVSEPLTTIGKRLLGHEPTLWSLRGIQRYAQSISDTSQQPYTLVLADGLTAFRIAPRKGKRTQAE